MQCSDYLSSKSSARDHLNKCFPITMVQTEDKIQHFKKGPLTVFHSFMEKTNLLFAKPGKEQ